MGKLYVIAGHGAGDPGACGNGYSEAERVRALANAIKTRGGNNVVLLDTSRNWYADGGINSLSIGKNDWLVELHMDSASASAKGAHVIIKAGIGGADKYDKALAASISAMFPGRAKTIVERSDLANPNRAAARGINYRLVENGFISNAGDVKIFNENINKLADLYLEAFGIKSNGSTAPSTPPSAGGGSSSSGSLTVDGYWGTATTKRLQQVLGAPYQDGVISRQDSYWKSRCPGCTTGWEWTKNGLEIGSQTIKLMQQRIGVTADGLIGPNTINALIKYYKSSSGATAYDGKLDAASITIKAMQRALNAGRF